tara:strand:- start:1997 stop:3286 length:1290 start_codon:yes stop_codon:yes gene_type:complete
MNKKTVFSYLKDYLNNRNSSLSTFEYINPGDYVGYKILKFLVNRKNFITVFYTIITNFLSLTIQNQYLLINKNKKKISPKKIILSWGFKENFDKNGNFKDKYLNITSNQTSKEYLWIIIYLSKKLPNKIKKNTFIFKQIHKKFSLFNFFLSIFKIYISSKKNFFLTLKSLNKNSVFAINFWSYINKGINFDKTKKIFIVYEGQPYQKYFIEKLNNQNLKIYGILHHPPHSLLYNFFKQKCISPKKLIVSGSLTKDILVKKYNWEKNNIILLPSFRNKKKRKNKKEIFISSNIYDRAKILKYFLKTINLLQYNISHFKISLHPYFKKESDYKFFERQINQIKINSSKFNYKPKNINFCIGVSSVIVELLESDIKVIHITESSTIEKYDNRVWKHINVKKLTDKSFLYCLEKKNTMHNIKNSNSYKMINKL